MNRTNQTERLKSELFSSDFGQRLKSERFDNQTILKNAKIRTFRFRTSTVQWNAKIWASKIRITPKFKLLSVQISALLDFGKFGFWHVWISAHLGLNIFKKSVWKPNVRYSVIIGDLGPNRTNFSPIVRNPNFLCPKHQHSVPFGHYERSDLGQCTNTEPSRIGPKVDRPKSELVWILDIHCTC